MDKYTYTTGRRKTSAATLRLFSGKGETLVNGEGLEKVYADPIDRALILEPMKVVDAIGMYYFTTKVKGGGVKSQAGAIRHALARALAKQEPEYKPILKKALMLRRDDRMTERKKTGLRKARKAPQFSKR